MRKTSLHVPLRRLGKLGTAITTVLAIAMNARVASAQSAQSSCGPGQIVVDNVGHCCSPGQGWNPQTAQCANFEPAASPQPASSSSPPPSTTVAPNTAGSCAQYASCCAAIVSDSGASSDACGQVAQLSALGPEGEATCALALVRLTMTMASRPGGVPPACAPGGLAVNPNAPVAITFAPEDPRDTETLRLQSVGGPVTTCNLPCVVNVAPGYLTITGTGQRDFETGINVPQTVSLTVQINHLRSNAPLFATGAALEAIGLGGAIAGIYLLAGSPSCGGTAITPIELEVQAMCNNVQGLDLGLGITLSILGGIGLIAGTSVLVHSARIGQHPVRLMNPGDISRPVSLNTSGLHFAGIDPVAIHGGGLLRAALTF